MFWHVAHLTKRKPPESTGINKKTLPALPHLSPPHPPRRTHSCISADTHAHARICYARTKHAHNRTYVSKNRRRWKNRGNLSIASAPPESSLFRERNATLVARVRLSHKLEKGAFEVRLRDRGDGARNVKGGSLDDRRTTERSRTRGRGRRKPPSSEDRRREEHPETAPGGCSTPISSAIAAGKNQYMIGRLAAWPRVPLTRRAANSAEGAPRAYSPRRISIDARRTRVFPSTRRAIYLHFGGGRTQAPRPTTLLRLSARSAVPSFPSSSGERRRRRQGRPRRGNAMALRRPAFFFFSKNPRRRMENLAGNVVGWERRQACLRDGIKKYVLSSILG